MTSDTSNLPEHIPTPPIEGRVAPPFDDPVGIEQAMITGLVFGTIFSITGRIWMVMCAHAAFDLAAVAIIYGNLETTVGHLVFK